MRRRSSRKTGRSQGQSEIDDLVDELSRLDQSDSASAATIGRLILERLYAGDARLWHSRNSWKKVSFRKLASHPRLPFSRTKLCRCVAIHVLSLRRPDVMAMPGIRLSHLREICHLDGATQDALLAASVARNWSARRLRSEVCRLQDDQFRVAEPFECTDPLVVDNAPASLAGVLKRLERELELIHHHLAVLRAGDRPLGDIKRCPALADQK